MLRGLMMDEPLLVSSLIVHADKFHGDTEIVSRTVEGPGKDGAGAVHRHTYRDAHRRARQIAQALGRLGVKQGDRVGTLAWNGYRHFELYFGVSGMGAVIHTINPRLFPEQIAYIANHAEDKYVFFDLTFAPLVEKLAGQCRGVKGWVAMTDRAHMPQSAIPDLLCYEELVAAENGQYEWPRFDEWTAAGLCYTSGTTGHPKGVLYAHRSTILHAYAASLPDVFAASARMTILPVVPMFHVNAWSIPYLAPLNGAKLVFPGAGLDGKSLYELFEAERVTVTAGVPTVWLGLLTYMRQNKLRFSTLERAVVGGSAAPPAMIRDFDTYGVDCQHAWGMTEMSPLGTLCTLKGSQLELPPEEQFALRCKQGRVIYGVDMKIVDGEGKSLPHDGKAFGDLMVRGPWITSGYFKEEGGNPLRDGWFPTGDVATIDPDGFMQITDRSKDVVKSGGEWISSIDLENIAIEHPAIAEAAVIGVRHPKWDERPIVVAVKKQGAEVTREGLLALYEGRVAKWMIPDDVVFVAELPHTATGKLSKLTLRQQMKDYKLPGNLRMSHILVERQGAIQRIRMNRPEKKNALTTAMYTAFAEAIRAADGDAGVRVMLVEGAGDAFTAGNDLQDFLAHASQSGPRPVLDFLQVFSHAAKPIVAAVHGVAVGVGTTMLAHCDLVYAAEGARFSMPFVNLGLCPENASSFLLPSICGYQRAAELLMFGEPFDAAKAREVGLVNAIVPLAELGPTATAAAQKLAGKPPASLRLTKRLLRRAWMPEIEAALAEESKAFAERLSSPEAKEAFTAFFEKRAPDFSRFG